MTLAAPYHILYYNPPRPPNLGCPNLQMSDTPPTLNDLLDQHFPGGFGTRGRRRVPTEELVIESGPLTAEHVTIAQAHEESGARLGSGDVTYELKNLRYTHHRLAQLLAAGMDETRAGILSNYTAGRVSVLKANPAFQELLAYYASTVEQEMVDFVSTSAALGIDILQELQRRLDEKPEQFTVSHLNDLYKSLADRTGHAPVTKSVNVNINEGLGERLRIARERAQARLTGT